MIISNSRKYVYIHIPKCGGSSISAYLWRKLLPQDVSLSVNQHKGWGPFIEMYRDIYGLEKHSTAVQIAQAMTVAHLRDYFVFTFSRNPFSRAYSAFNFTKQSDAEHRPDSERYREIRDMTFEEFLMTRYVQEHRLFQTFLQTDWVRNSPVPIKIYKLEKLDAALDDIKARLFADTRIAGAVPYVNQSSDKDEWKSMSPQAQDIIKQCYKEDFETFGYSTTID